jgi:hypothetical protein
MTEKTATTLVLIALATTGVAGSVWPIVNTIALAVLIAALTVGLWLAAHAFTVADHTDIEVPAPRELVRK